MMKTPASRQQGVALIEFALVLPLLLILSFITTEFGRAFYEYNTLAKAVRDAARYLSVQDPSIQSTDRAKITVARELVVYGRPDVTGASQPLLAGLSLANVPEANIQWALAGSNPAINTSGP
jgi:Flp pilus assembly protein TadG